MRIKKITVLALTMVLVFQLTACAGREKGNSASESVTETESETENTGEEVSITLWTYPVGDWATPGTVSGLITGFHEKYPNYHVSVEYLDYVTGDDRVSQAIEDGALPDLVLEGPERLVANWGDRGLMVDLSDLWESEEAEEIFEPVKNACRHRNGDYYIFPICMTAHCMAINYDMFREAGALPYIDEKNHTWTKDGFIHAVDALADSGQEKIATVYCGGQGGDQGTRALVTNLCGGKFANEKHTEYIFDSPENIEALELLRGMDGVVFDAAALGTDDIERFVNQEQAMALCWNVSVELSQIVNNPDLGFDIFPMAFPSDDAPTLQGGIWGFGVFDNGDDGKIAAAKEFIRYLTENDRTYEEAVLASRYWPVREVPGIYDNDELMTEYGMFTQYLGDYYQVTPGWADSRTAWWKMLQKIGDGADIAQAAKEFEDTSNAAAKASGQAG